METELGEKSREADMKLGATRARVLRYKRQAQATRVRYVLSQLLWFESKLMGGLCVDDPSAGRGCAFNGEDTAGSAVWGKRFAIDL